ncbi:hypothetical protein [Corynebacterium cystitidis]|uniref:Uncharacterized protein n=1 Tax=Corynebacterium cystitidis DSM 20524 TaxID=1121357 RepID=A0A1H9UKP7_9CORY|nr:hypothetical protein [Corynebacterium cystitidis]WJY80998.1 hypothetical protein CCYS_00050 [Corynebacterium cystitidis DSM 20524]SES09754.1 hypothetical protein SAMN05661109_01839 [Corynebacterium cystitidis DSM 20524]SNV90799.1 TetR family regulatory protein [Corynebacterium cystitidis]
MVKALRPEQLLIIADHFCAQHGVELLSFSDLAAAAAVPGARFDTVALYSSSLSASDALATYLRRLQPLSALNDEFAVVAAEVYRRWCTHDPT